MFIGIISLYSTQLLFYFYYLIGTFRCPNVYFHVALGSSMGLALLVWVGGGLLKRVCLYFFGNERSLGQKSLTVHLPLLVQ